MLQDSAEIQKIGPRAACATTALQAASVLQQSIKELAVISVVQERASARAGAQSSGTLDGAAVVHPGPATVGCCDESASAGAGLASERGSGSGSIIILVRCPRRCRRQKGALCASCLSPLRRRNYSEIAVE